MMKRQDGRVYIDLSEAEFNGLLTVLGYALGAALQDQDQLIANAMLRLANAVNEGNPQWSPYAVGEAGATAFLSSVNDLLTGAIRRDAENEQLARLRIENQRLQQELDYQKEMRRHWQKVAVERAEERDTLKGSR